MKTAESVEDIITIESRLSEVRYQLESMESQIRTYDNQIDYSTVNIDISEVKNLTPAAQENRLSKMAKGFVNSLKNLGTGILDLGMNFVINIPYILIIVLFVIIIVIVIRKINKKKHKKDEKHDAGK